MGIAGAGALLQGIGAVTGGISSAFGASKQNKAARNMMLDQMQFQKDMKWKHYQNSVVDLRQAGLNPILALSSGGSFGSPSGASVSGYTPTNEGASVGEGISKASEGVGTALQYKILKEQATNIKNDTKLKQTQSNKNQADTHYADQAANKALQDSWTAIENQKYIKAQARKVKQETINSAKAGKVLDAEVSKALTDAKFYNSDIGKVFRLINQAGGDIKGLSSAVSLLKGLK